MSIYGLLGKTLKHSFSPQIHFFLGGYPYRLFEVTPDEIDVFMKRREFSGINVTIPYKKTVIPYCDELSDRVKRIGSVNTIIHRNDGTLFGHNTDYDGFLYLLTKTGMNLAGKKALILGSGGSCVTVQAVLEDQNAGEIVIISRSGKNNYNTLSDHADASLIVNTTPVGMYPNTDASPVSLADFPSCEAVIDIIYNPAMTRLLFEASQRNIPFMNGLPMLVAQAKSASELFCQNSIDNTIIDDITARIDKQTRNVMLIGMPSSGKSTVGKLLASLTERSFKDTDQLIYEHAGTSIPQIIQRDGEAAFRSLETRALQDISKESGLVIATGGGIVTIPENLPLVRQNSTVIFLNRDLSKLTADGRPLSQQFGIETLYHQRLPLYQQWADIVIDCNGTVEQTADAIRKALDL